MVLCLFVAGLRLGRIQVAEWGFAGFGVEGLGFRV